MPPLTKTDWSQSWEKHLCEYLAVAPRTGQHLELLFPEKKWRFLELAGGSLRDANYLAKRGYNSTGSDYLDEIVDKARRAHDNPALDTLVLDAFNTGQPLGAFDVTFHNGLLICFEDDGTVKRLLDEQSRITKGFMVVIVHSWHNAELRELFQKKSADDKLYDVRFFAIPELRRLLAPYGKVRLYGFGGSVSGNLLPSGRLGRLPLPLRRVLYRTLAPWEPPSRWERILATVQLPSSFS